MVYFSRIGGVLNYLLQFEFTVKRCSTKAFRRDQVPQSRYTV